MSPIPTSETKAAESLEQLATHLFDAVRYSEQAEALEEQARAAQKESEETLAMMDGLTRHVSSLLEGLKESSDTENVKQLSSQVTEFVKAAVEQAKSRTSSEAARHLSETGSRVTSEKEKAIKSLESYLVFSPLPIMERGLTVKMGESGYEAEAVYTCKGGIKYRFALATQNSKFFRGEFTLSLFDIKLNIPVALAKTWIKKEPTPRYEKLEKYALAWAEVTGSHTIIDFLNTETQSRIRMVSSTPEGEGFTTVEFTEGEHVTNVTTDTGLNKHLSRKAVTEALQKLRSELLALEGNKAALTELVTNGDNTLKSLDCEALLIAVLKLMGPAYRTVVQKMASKPPESDTSKVSLSMLRERLALLGPSSSIVKEALALT